MRNLLQETEDARQTAASLVARAEAAVRESRVLILDSQRQLLRFGHLLARRSARTGEIRRFRVARNLCINDEEVRAFWADDIVTCTLVPDYAPLIASGALHLVDYRLSELARE